MLSTTPTLDSQPRQVAGMGMAEIMQAEAEMTSHQLNEMAQSSASTQLDADGKYVLGAPAPPEVEPFPFMKLPLELRTEVYKIALVVPGGIQMSSKWTHNYRGYDFSAQAKSPEVCVDSHANFLHIHQNCRPFKISTFNIWFASKAVYHESMPIFFRYNFFQFENLDCIRDFLPCLGPTSRRNITSVSFRYFGKAPAQTFRLLKECVGLRHLKIEILLDTAYNIPSRLGPSGCNLMKAHGLADLLKIRGIKELNVLFAADVEWPFKEGNIPEFDEALQVLKQPHKPAQLTRQEKKDYPQTGGRTVFGNTNVKTRAEEKLIALKPPNSD